jgi:hypothetical protein
MRHGILAIAVFVFTSVGFGQSGSMTLVTGLNTVQEHIGASAAPDPTIAVGTLEFCEHVNSAYQCWYKSGPNAFQPVNFMGNTNPKADSTIWSQHSNNSGNTPNCPTANSPNAQLLHDNVYKRWILQKRIASTINGHEYLCVAISNVEDVSQTTPVDFNWFAFEFDLDTVIPKNPEGTYYYPDYPQAGLWQASQSTTPPYPPAKSQAMWITYDLQDPNNAYNIGGVLVCAVDLAGLRASTFNPWVNKSHTPACAVAHPLVAFNQRRSWMPANNSDTTPPISTDGEMFTYMIEPAHNHGFLTNPNHTQGVEQWTINWAAATPAPAFVKSWDLPSTGTNGDQLACFTPANYYDTVCIPQPSTAKTGIFIDSVGDRMQQLFHYTSNGGKGGIWTSAHTIQISPSQTLSQTEADLRILQWNTAVPPAIEVAADYPVKDPQDSNAYVALPSVARDKVGNLQGILGVSGAGSNEHPGLDGVYLTAGSSTLDSYGYIANPNTDGDAEDTDPADYRWGDWYGAVLDPSDSCTVWVIGEYLPANRTTSPYWYTAIAELPPMSSCSAAGAR